MNEVWILVGQQLRPRDLCAMMQCSRGSFYLWITDRMWMNQRRRMCCNVPQLAAVFDAFAGDAAEHTAKRSMKSNNNKKRKTAWIMPRAGIWYVFKRWLARGFDKSGFSELYDKPRLHPIVLGVIMMNLPCREFMVNYTVSPKEHKGMYMHVIINFKHGYISFQRNVRNSSNNIFIHILHGETHIIPSYMNCYFYAEWRCAVLQGGYGLCYGAQQIKGMNKIK